jgi:thiamine-phosphate pyrophosphorylase
MMPRERLATARLYLVCPARPRAWLQEAVAGGVDILQLRDKTLDDDGLIAAAREFKATGALFILNDRPDLVDACQADGVHVGQDDQTPAQARAAVGPDRIVGRSTHAPAQALVAQADPDVDYLAVGPVHATPTKPGRPPTGLGYVETASKTITKPWFAIGGIDAHTAHEVLGAGAGRIVVVRAITEADDPREAAQKLRRALHAGDVAGGHQR